MNIQIKPELEQIIAAQIARMKIHIISNIKH